MRDFANSVESGWSDHKQEEAVNRKIFIQMESRLPEFQ